MEVRVYFGWGAPPIGDQFPKLHEKQAEQFQKDSDAITRLSIRGLMTDSQRAMVCKKFTKKLADKLKAE